MKAIQILQTTTIPKASVLRYLKKGIIKVEDSISYVDIGFNTGVGKKQSLMLCKPFITKDIKNNNIQKRYFSTLNYTKSITEAADPILSQEIVNILSKRFNFDIQIKSTTQLSDPERPNIVHRIMLESFSNEVPKSLILKQFATEKFSDSDKETLGRFTRDWAGLEFLSGLETINPRKFYGGSHENRFILMEDLGEKHISLVDSLTVKDKNLAEAALKRFMISLGQFHASCYGKTDHYSEVLKNLNPNVNPWQDDLKMTLEYMLHNFTSILKQLGVSYTSDVQKEINNIINSTLMPGPFSTFVHGDICPDNVFDNPQKNEIRIIDFEWAFVGNALLDGTYLSMSMPTCWCAKTIPKDLIKSLEVIYRQELIKNIPAAGNDYVYYAAYTDACAYWMLKSILFIEEILDKDSISRSGPLPEQSMWEPETNLLRPRTLTSLQTFSEVAKQYNHLPHLRSMAEHLLDILKIRWPDAKPLDMYPAFVSQVDSELCLTGDSVSLPHDLDV